MDWFSLIQTIVVVVALGLSLYNFGTEQKRQRDEHKKLDVRLTVSEGVTESITERVGGHMVLVIISNRSDRVLLVKEVVLLVTAEGVFQAVYPFQGDTFANDKSRTELDGFDRWITTAQLPKGLLPGTGFSGMISGVGLGKLIERSSMPNEVKRVATLRAIVVLNDDSAFQSSATMPLPHIPNAPVFSHAVSDQPQEREDDV